MREACREFLEGELKLALNMETHITHVNDGFVFLGHRIIRKRGPRGRMRPVTTIPWKKYRGFAERLVKQLSGNYGMNRMDLMERLNRQIAGWAAFYQYTDFTATMFSKLDRHGCCKAKTVEAGMGRWRFGVSLPVGRVNSGGVRRRKIRTSCAMRPGTPSSRAIPMSPSL